MIYYNNISLKLIIYYIFIGYGRALQKGNDS